MKLRFALAAALALSASSAVAQELKSVFERDRPDYAALGVRAGSFTIRPEAQLDYTRNTNIFAQDVNPVDDNITTFKPGVTAESDWSTHSLKAYANANIGRYADNDREDFDDHAIGAEGRLDVMRETQLTLRAEHAKKHEDRGSANSPALGRDPTEYTADTIGAGFRRGISRFSVAVSGEHKKLDYDNVPSNAGGVVNNNTRDRDEQEISLRLGYEIRPEYTVFAQTTRVERDYDTPGAINRDSEGWRNVIGAGINLSGKTRGEVFVGGMNRDYKAATLRNIDGATWGANVLWNASDLTSVRLGMQRDIEETTLTNASGFVATATNLRVEHELMRNFLLAGEMQFGTNKYQGGTLRRADDLQELKLEGNYMLTRNWSVIGGYKLDERDSDNAGQDFTRNRFTVGLKGAL